MLVIGAAQEVVSQQPIVSCAVVVEEVDIGLHVGSGEGLVVAVALVDAVQLSAHTAAVRLCGAAANTMAKTVNRCLIILESAYKDSNFLTIHQAFS